VVKIDGKVSVEPGSRVTVKISNLHTGRHRYHGSLIDSQQIKRESGLYWGYKVRIALSLHDALYGEEYDVIIGTSERGKPLNEFQLPLSEKKLAEINFSRILVVFGGLEGLEAAVEADESIGCSAPEQLFEHYVNSVPGQGSRTIRTEEAIPITLSRLRPLICAELS
ncbi:unnamed protein product, partial [Gongylonema pulchrum]|uniref:RNA-binding protein n=1 Tax=Gongylonema pulchrum TaxID=637853 RepID=A0A183D8E4_9BILA